MVMTAARSQHMALGTPAERVQLVMDWHCDMQEKGKPVAQRFNLKMIYELYHQLQRGEPLRRGQLSSLSKIIQRWHIDDWMAKNYPEAKDIAPAPAPPPDAGFAFCSDDEA